MLLSALNLFGQREYPIGAPDAFFATHDCPRVTTAKHGDRFGTVVPIADGCSSIVRLADRIAMEFGLALNAQPVTESLRLRRIDRELRHMLYPSARW